jgi:hypothetical protein
LFVWFFLWRIGITGSTKRASVLDAGGAPKG